MTRHDQPLHDQVRNHPKPRRKVSAVTIVLAIIVLILAGAATYFYLQYQNIRDNPEAVGVAQTQDLVQRVERLIALPEDEEPTIATVEDKSKLADQAFFADAENGDQLLIYTKSQRAIIYRPSENRIINVGPVSIDDTSEGTSQ
jgi:CHASE3 domain sensor protein